MSKRISEEFIRQTLEGVKWGIWSFCFSFTQALGNQDILRGCDESAKILLAQPVCIIQRAGGSLCCCVWLHYYYPVKFESWQPEQNPCLLANMRQIFPSSDTEWWRLTKKWQKKRKNYLHFCFMSFIECQNPENCCSFHNRTRYKQQ